jgi:hypothetical protein
MGTKEEIAKIKAAIEKFPEFFGLRAFPGRRFKILLGQCFFSEGRIQLYTYIEDPDETGEWLAFSRGTPIELRREVVAL